MSTGSNEQMITGGELVAKALKAEGVEVIYTLCGGHIIDIYNGCLNEGIKIIDVRHEEVASHAADGYARMTGKPWVCSCNRWTRHDTCINRSSKCF